MSNQVAHDKMCTLWEKTAETTSMNMTLSKDLDVYQMGSMANKDQTGSADDTNFGTGEGDVEFIPQEYRFMVKDGVETTDTDFQDVIDRMIPANRKLAFNVPATIKAKELQDPNRVQRVVKAFARDIANKIDLVCYNKMIEQSTMFVSSDTKFDFQDAIDAETLMLNRGLSAFDRKLFLSNKHYAAVAKELGQASREVFTGDAISRARIPDLATFQTMRSDYLINVVGNGTTGVTVNGASQDHTVKTYKTDGFYEDNRSQLLTMSGITADTFPVGTKFTIAGVNAVHPETREDTGELLEFTVIEANATTPRIQPAIVTLTGATPQFANATAAPADSAVVTVLNKKLDAPSLFYTPESTVIIPGQVPVVGEGVATQSLTTENGIPMTMIYWFDGHKMQYNMKAVFNFDVQVLYPNMLGAIYANQA